MSRALNIFGVISGIAVIVLGLGLAIMGLYAPIFIGIGVEIFALLIVLLGVFVVYICNKGLQAARLANV